MKKISFLFALLCASVMCWGTKYCGEAVQSTVENTSVSISTTVKRSGDKTLLVQFESPLIASIRDGGCFQGWGDGAVWENQTDAVQDFELNWTHSGNTWSKEFTFSTYPISGTGQIYALFSLTEGIPAGAGFTLTSVDLFTDCTTPAPEPTEATFSVNSHSDNVSATITDDDVSVSISTYGGGQWSRQVKLEHNLSYDNAKSYKLAFDLTANKDCGGITLKTDDNNGIIYENQSINLIANTPFHYEKVFVGQAGNNKITVFDFGWVGNETDITIGDLTLIEYSPATASSTNGDLIPFKAVDGKTGTRWQAASKGEAWWKMDYGTAQSFNRVNITWETSYAKSFTIQGSNDDETYTVLKTISGQTIASPNNYKQVIDLDQTYNYRYVKFVGTENGNDYGFSFYEFEILEVETSVLTDVIYTYPKRKTVCAVGQSIDVTAIARDQYEEPMAGQTITYTVSPAAKGTIDANGHYTANEVGEVTITATCSDKSATATVVNTISGNLALKKTATAGDGETPVSMANDNSLTSYWSLGPNKTSDKWWWQVDLGQIYDLSLVIIKWEGACPTTHTIKVSTDGTNWTDAATRASVSEIGKDDDDNYEFYSINAQAQYVRIQATGLVNTGWGMKIYDFQAFGTLAATPTKNVSASVNDELMGTATVKQDNADVTEVETGSEVTFSAVANDGYIFVNWTSGSDVVSTQASFDTQVNVTMNLTANFRALGNIYCNTLVHSSNGGQDHDAYVTMKRTAENTYQLIVRAEYQLGNFSNTEFRIKAVNAENTSNYILNGQGVLTDNNHTLTGTITSTIEPEMISGKLYVNIVGQYEGQFDRLTNIEYSQPCADPEITEISLDVTEATLEIGNTLTLTPSLTPAYMSADITWQTSDDQVATVANGVVTPVAPGNVTITAKITESVKATCAVTVQAAQSHNWYGYGTSQDLDYTYRIEFNTDHYIVAHVKRQGAKEGLVDAFININNNITSINVTEGEDVGWKKGTTAQTYKAGDNITIILQSNWAGPSSILSIPYTVGADNVMPTIEPSTLSLSKTNLSMGLSDADVQLTAEIHHRDAANQTITWTSDDESVVTVVDGLVHPVGVGTTTIRATTFNDIEATCAVTIVGTLEPTVFWGNGIDGDVSIAYSITRNSNHTLTYAIEALHNKTEFSVQVNDGQYHGATLSEGIYTWTSETTYIDGDPLSGFIYMPFGVGGAARVNFSYTIGAKSARKYIPISLTENADNSSVISASAGAIREARVNRSFATDKGHYTLVLPFDVDADQVANVLKGTVTELRESYQKENGDLKLNFVDVTSMTAGKAYLYLPSQAVANPVFENVTIKSALVTTDTEKADFIGIYAPMTIVDLQGISNSYVLGADNYLYESSQVSTTGGDMKALRAYFTLDFQEQMIQGRRTRAMVVFNEPRTDMPTDVEAVEEIAAPAKRIENGQLIIEKNGRLYNAQGQVIR